MDISNYIIIRVLDEVGNWYDNSFVENDFDAIQIGKFYRNKLGYSVQLWKRGKDITFLIDE